MKLKNHIQNLPAIGGYFTLGLVLLFLLLNGGVIILHSGEFDKLTLLINAAIIINVTIASFWIGRIKNILIQVILILVVISINQFCITSVLMTSDRFYEPYPKALY